MKKLLLLLIFPTLAFAASSQQRRAAVAPGFTVSNNTSSTSFNAANTWVAFGFRTDAAKTLNNAILFTGAFTASPVAADARLDLYADNGGKPAAAATETKAAASFTASTWNSWTGYTTALSADTQYWLVHRNINGAPATNFWAVDTEYTGGSTIGSLAVANDWNGGSGGFVKLCSTDGGTTWASCGGTDRPLAFGLRIGFSDSTYMGLPLRGVTSDSSNEVRGTREWGVCFTWPATWPTGNLRGVGALPVKTGTSPTSIRFRAYTGGAACGSGGTPTRQATTSDITGSQIQSGSVAFGYFSSNVSIAAGTTVRLVMGTSVADGGSGNAMRMYYEQIENSASSRGLMPFGGWMLTSSTDGTTFTDTNTSVPQMYFSLDTNGEFTVSGGLKGINTASGGAQ